MRDDGSAEITVQQATDVDGVLHQHRTVEAILLAQGLVPHGVDAALPGQRLDRIARHQPYEHEGQKGDPNEGRDHETQPGEDEPEHRRSVTRTKRSPLDRDQPRYFRSTP